MLATPDSGASVSLISHDVTQKHRLDIIKHEKMAIAAANDSSIRSEGSIDVVGENTETKRKARMKVQVTKDMKNEMLISYSDLKALKIIPSGFPLVECKRVTTNDETETLKKLSESLITEFSGTVSDELPKIPVKCKPKEIVLREGPVVATQVTRARPVPIHFQEKAFKLLQKLEEAGIISEEVDATDWVSPAMFVVKPNGEDVRLVTDYTGLNQYIKGQSTPSWGLKTQSGRLARTRAILPRLTQSAGTSKSQFRRPHPS